MRSSGIAERTRRAPAMTLNQSSATASQTSGRTERTGARRRAVEWLGDVMVAWRKLRQSSLRDLEVEGARVRRRVAKRDENSLASPTPEGEDAMTLRREKICVLTRSFLLLSLSWATQALMIPQVLVSIAAAMAEGSSYLDSSESSFMASEEEEEEAAEEEEGEEEEEEEEEAESEEATDAME